MAATGHTDAPPQPERPDVFVSYARSEGKFVDAVLGPRLVARGKDLWIDREDIPAASEWETRVRLGIEASNAFLFLITPSSVKSAQCAKELKHATDLRKRLIPVVRSPVEDDRVPSELRPWNWIWLRDEDDLDAGIERVVDALDTDLDWRDMHSRLNVRALEWDRNQRDSSFLLRGRDLSAAEAWHSRQGGHRESPTPLQGEYIFASRRAAGRRQRQLLGSVLVALAVAIGLAVFALIQRSQAVQQEHRSRSRELALSAQSVLDSDPELSLLIAREAARASGTAEAEEALRTALAESRVRLTVHHKGPVTSAAFSPDGRRLITAGKDGYARIWDATTGRLLAGLKQPARDVRWVAFDRSGRRAVVASVEGDHESTGDIRVVEVPSGRHLSDFRSRSFGYTAEFAPDGEHLLTTGPIDPAVIWTLRSPTLLDPLRTLNTRNGTVDAAALSADGRRVALSLDRFGGDPLTSHSVEIRSARTGRTILALQGNDGMGTSVRFSPDGHLLATTGISHAVPVWDADTGLPVANLRGHEDYPAWADFSPGSRLVATAAADGAVRVFESRSGRTLLVLRGSTKPLSQVEFSPDGTRVVSAGEDGTARVWDVSGLPAAPVTPPASYDAAVSRDGRRAVVAVGNLGAELWDVGARRRITRLPRSLDAITDVAFSHDGRRIMTVAYSAASARILDARSGRLVSVLHGPESIDSAPFAPGNERVAGINPNGDAGVWDAATGRTLRLLPHPEGDAFHAAAFSPDGRLIATGELEAVTLWDSKTGRRVARNPGERQGLSTVWNLVFSPDGRLLLAIDDHDLVRVLDARTLKLVARLKGHTSLVSSAAFSPDSQLVVTASDDQTARIWRARTGEELARLTGHGGDVTSASFSRDGRFVVTTTGDNAARIWSAATGRRIATVTAPRGAAYTAAFRPDSRSLVLTGPGLPPIVRRCELCGGLDELLQLADHRVTRPFTSRERATYLHQK